MNSKIFFTKDVIKNENNLKNYDYIKTNNLNNYLLLTKNKKFKYKMLFPYIENYNRKNIYANNNIKLLFPHLNYSDNLDDCFLFLHENDTELENIEDYKNFIKNSIIYKINKNNDINKKKINFLINLNNSIIRNNSNKEEIFLKDLNNSYQFIDFSVKNINRNYKFKKNKLYILKRDGTKLYDKSKIIFDFEKKYYFMNNNIIIYKIDNNFDKEFIILCKFDLDTNIKFIDLLKNNNFIDNDVVGYNDKKLDYYLLYYIYGKAKLWELYYPLSELHNYHLKVLSNNEKKYNQRKFLRFLSFHKGYYNKRLNINDLEKNYVDQNLEKVLLISKSINGYGGNQKTAKQLYLNLSKKYDLYVWSLAPSEDGIFDFQKDELCDLIHNQDIIKIKDYDNIVEHINNTNYSIVINNKLNELFKIIIRLNKKINVITHNSMDPFNRMILNNQRYIDKVFTINKIHSDLFIKNKLKCKILRYLNHINIDKKCKERNKFKNQLVFIGRLSNEKNINLLLNAFDFINKKSKLKDKLKLVILGDGKGKFYRNIDNVKYYGKVDFEFVKLVLLNSDYLILPSSVEGIPFTVLESMSLGIPCISTNINGINEVVNKDNGFLFDLHNYDNYKDNIDNWKVMKCVEDNLELNSKFLASKILEAYDIEISEWNNLSKKSFNFIKKRFNQDYVDKYNFTSFFLY